MTSQAMNNFFFPADVNYNHHAILVTKNKQLDSDEKMLKSLITMILNWHIVTFVSKVLCQEGKHHYPHLTHGERHDQGHP